MLDVKKTIKVAVHGSYFANNFGDTLLVKLLCDEIAKHIGKDNVFLAREANPLDQDHINYPVIPKDQRSIITHLIYSGGGYLGEPNTTLLNKVKWSIRNYFRHFYWAKDFVNAQRSFIGVGLGPINVRFFRNLVGHNLGGATHVLLRDRESLAYYNEYKFSGVGVDTCVDYALSLKNENPAVPRKKIALHLSELTIDEISCVLAALRDSHYRNEEIDVIFDVGTTVPQQQIEKYNSAFLREQIDVPVNFKAYKGVDELLCRLATYRMVVTSKLHVGIVSIALGGKVVSIPSHQKTVRLYNQLGLAKFCIARNELNSGIIKSTIDSRDFNPSRKIVDEGVAKINEAIASIVTPKA